jgi:hypothetical protein
MSQKIIIVIRLCKAGKETCLLNLHSLAPAIVLPSGDCRVLLEAIFPLCIKPMPRTGNIVSLPAPSPRGPDGSFMPADVEKIERPEPRGGEF